MSAVTSSSVRESWVQDPRFKALKNEFLSLLDEYQTRTRQIKPSMDDRKMTYESLICEFQKERGRDLFYPFLSTGFGSGPFIELADGSVKYDLITGIGVHFFGHGHPELVSVQLEEMAGPVMHGNLQPAIEAQQITHRLLELAKPGTRLEHAWLTTCGTMANEIALKILRQKKFPATKILAFKDCFAGRSTAMQEITDNPAYRDGQPLYGEVSYLPIYNNAYSLDQNIKIVIQAADGYLTQSPGKYAALMLEIVQGEGGFTFGPKEFYKALFEHLKQQGVMIWADEIQTFGRTGSAFAYQTFELGPYIDVVTVAKTLQASATMFTAELNPRAGLVAGTFTGSATALRAGNKILELMNQPGFFGPDGRVYKAGERFKSGLKRIQSDKPAHIKEIRAIGGMIAFQPFEGTMANIKLLLKKLFDHGVVAFYCGHDPYFIRLLPALGVMTDMQIDEVLSIVQKSLLECESEMKGSKN